jgi:hypothetical protein
VRTNVRLPSQAGCKPAVWQTEYLRYPNEFVSSHSSGEQIVEEQGAFANCIAVPELITRRPDYARLRYRLGRI